MERHAALLIRQSGPTDPALAGWTMPGHGMPGLAKSLSVPGGGPFAEVEFLENPTPAQALRVLERLAHLRGPGDALLVVFAGPVWVTPAQELWLGVGGTDRLRLRSTALLGQALAMHLEQSPSLAKLLVLDAFCVGTTEGAEFPVAEAPLERIFLGRHKACAALCLEKKVHPLSAASPPGLLAAGQDLCGLLARSFRELSMGQSLVLRAEDWFQQAKAFGREPHRPLLLAPEGAIPFRLPLSPVIEPEAAVTPKGRGWHPVRESTPGVVPPLEDPDLQAALSAGFPAGGNEPRPDGDPEPRPSEKSWEEISGEVPLEDLRWETLDRALDVEPPEPGDGQGGDHGGDDSIFPRSEEPTFPGEFETTDALDSAAASETHDASEPPAPEPVWEQAAAQNPDPSPPVADAPPPKASPTDFGDAGHTLFLSPSLDENGVVPAFPPPPSEGGENTIIMPPDLDAAAAPGLVLGEPLPSGAGRGRPSEPSSAHAEAPESDPFAAFKAKLKAQEEAMRFAEETEQAELLVQEDRIQEWKKGLQEDGASENPQPPPATEPQSETGLPVSPPVFGAATWAQDQVATMFMPGEDGKTAPPSKRGMPLTPGLGPDAALHTLAMSREELLGPAYGKIKSPHSGDEEPNPHSPPSDASRSAGGTGKPGKPAKPRVAAPSSAWEDASISNAARTRAEESSASEAPPSRSSEPSAAPAPAVSARAEIPSGSHRDLEHPAPGQTRRPDSPNSPRPPKPSTPSPASRSASPPLPKGLEDSPEFSVEEYAPMWPEPPRTRWLKPLLYAVVIVGGFSMLFGLAVMTGLWERINRPPQTTWEPSLPRALTPEQIAASLRETVSQSLKRDRPSLEALYGKHAQGGSSSGGLQGEIQVSLEVQPYGGVTQARVRSASTAAPAFEKAVARLLSQWSFASFPADAPKWVTVKLNFPLPD